MRSTRGHDLVLYAAGITLFAAIGIIPLLLLAVRLAGLVTGEDTLRRLSGDLTSLIPANLGAREAGERLVQVGTRLPWTGVLAAVLPGSLYGEGLVRAFDRLSVRGERGRRSIRGRTGSAVFIVLSPFLLLGAVLLADGLTHVLGVGRAPRLLGIYLTFLFVWLAVSPLLALAYRALAPERPGSLAVAWGAYGTGSVIAGFMLGWVLFLSIRVPLEAAFGGSVPLAAAAVSMGWLLLLHVLMLVGYLTTLRLDARGGHPRGAVIRQTLVREA